MNAVVTFDRSLAIRIIIEFVNNAPADPEGFRAWLEGLTDDQLSHYYASIMDGADQKAGQTRIAKSERHAVHAANEAGQPVCGGGNGAKGVHGWQTDIGQVTCKSCLVILARRLP